MIDHTSMPYLVPTVLAVAVYYGHYLTGRKIMAMKDDLNTSLVDLKTAVDAAVAKMAELRAAQGTSDADVAAAVANVKTAMDALNAAVAG